MSYPSTVSPLVPVPFQCEAPLWFHLVAFLVHPPGDLSFAKVLRHAVGSHAVSCGLATNGLEYPPTSPTRLRNRRRKPFRLPSGRRFATQPRIFRAPQPFPRLWRFVEPSREMCERICENQNSFL